eukprot:1881350-Amphidinium_carterae.1
MLQETIGRFHADLLLMLALCRWSRQQVVLGGIHSEGAELPGLGLYRAAAKPSEGASQLVQTKREQPPEYNRKGCTCYSEQTKGVERTVGEKERGPL